MGLLGNSTSLMRFRVEAELPPDYRSSFEAGIVREAFSELPEDSIDQRRCGWVDIMNMFDNRFSGLQFLKDNFLALSMRIDCRRVPARALKIFSRKAEIEELSKTGKEFLSKVRKAEIRERVQDRLLARVIPSTDLYDMVWDLPKKTVIFSTTSLPVVEEFRDLFKKSFELSLIPLFPYTHALVHCQGLEKERLDRLSVSDFT